MYPEFVTEPFGKHAEYWFSSPEPHELTELGVLSREALDDMDLRLCALIVKKMENWEPQYELGVGTDPLNRWRAVSSLQKAVRFGDAEHACFVASAATDMNPDYVMRRLCVIGMEDVAFGNLFATVAAQAAAHSVVWRRKLGERRFYVWLSELMANSPKDRTATELIVLAAFKRGLNKEAAAECSSEELEEVVRDKEAQIDHRIICGWLLAGTKRFPDDNMPVTERSWQHFFRMMLDMGMPRVMLYAAHRSAFRCPDKLFPSLFLMHEWMSQTDALAVEQPEVMPLIEKVGVLLGPAYDMHTREGRVAMRRFEKECPAVGKFRHMLTEDADTEARKLLMGFGMFLAEGGVLHHRMVYGQSDHARYLAHRAELNFPGVPESEHADFLAALRGNLGQLNQIRREVVMAAHPIK